LLTQIVAFEQHEWDIVLCSDGKLVRK